MKIHESAENYLETILRLQMRNGQVRAIDIANELEFSKPSVSVAMKNLREHGYIETNSAGHIILLDKGLVIAQSIMERHTILTSWLVSMGVDPDVASEDACKMEHVMSAESIAAIKKSLEKK